MATQRVIVVGSVRHLQSSFAGPLRNLSLPSHCTFYPLLKPQRSPHLSCRGSILSSQRYVSTVQGTVKDASSVTTRLKNLFLGTAIGAFVFLTYLYLTDTRAGVHQWLVVPSLRWIFDDAEEAHEVGVKALKTLHDFGIHPRERGSADKAKDLEVEIFGHTICNPIGTSAGIDKHAEIPSPLFALGPAVIEVGGATPNPQDGNPKPRVFRLPSQKAMINRYGLNSEGADNMAMRLRQRVREYAYAMGFGMDEAAERRILDGEAGVPPGSLIDGKLMAVQVAKNKTTPDNDIKAIQKDYVYCVNALAKYADIIVVNVSSPNTPGLRDLQRVKPLTNILTAVVEAAKRVDRKTSPVVMVKVSPDEDSEEQVSGIVQAVWQSGVDGVIVGNTTKRRHDLHLAGYSLPEREAAILLEEGGYSGPQLFNRTVALVKRYRRLLDDGIRLSRSTDFQSSPTIQKTDSPNNQPPSQTPTRKGMSEVVAHKIEATVQRDLANLKDDTPEAHADSKSQPFIRIPARHNPFSSHKADTNDPPALSSSSHIDQLPSPAGDTTSTIEPSPMVASLDSTATPPTSLTYSMTSPTLDTSSHFTPSPAQLVPPTSLKNSSSTPPTPSQPPSPASQAQKTTNLEVQPKVIFATGGITNGTQALEVLNAGANVAMVYTALVYGGVGTISRIKEEMRAEIRNQSHSK